MMGYWTVELPSLKADEQLVLINERPVVFIPGDANQLILPFEQDRLYLAIQKKPEDEKSFLNQLKSLHDNWLKGRRFASKTGSGKAAGFYVRVPARCRPMYIYEKDVHQYPLRFTRNMKGNPAYQRLEEHNWKKLVEANFPVWELDENGQPWKFETQEDINRDDLIAWAQEGLRGQYYIEWKKRYRSTSLIMYCETARDAIAAKLRWG